MPGDGASWHAIESNAPDRMTLVHAHRGRWCGEQSHTIEICTQRHYLTSQSRVGSAIAGLFKAAFLGRRHDLLLLDELWEKYDSLRTRLDALGTSLKTGLILGDRSRDADFLKNLPLLRRGLRHWSVPDDVPLFNEDRAERPRRRRIFCGPLLVLGEYMRGGPRPVTAVSERDLVYTDAYFGVSFGDNHSDAAYLVSGILSSALASWYVLMTGSTFGLWIQRLKSADVVGMPSPDLDNAVKFDVGQRIVHLVRSFHHESPGENSLKSLDDAVFDLYELADTDRIVVRTVCSEQLGNGKRAA